MIPVIDLHAFANGTAADRKSIAEKVDTTCRRIGFLVVDNHGVSDKIISAAWDGARQFFDLPLKDKLSARSNESGCPRGYFPIEAETLARTRGNASLPDPKEAFSSGPPAAPVGHEHSEDFRFFYGDNLWPAALPEFQRAWLDYYQAMESLGTRLMQLLAAALNLETNFFEPFHSHHLSALRGINYPSSPTADTAQRAGAHSDYGSVTILLPDPEVAGLEVQTPDGNWIRPTTVDGSFIVNIGDLMARWTNDRWVSTLHRVVAPNEQSVPRRQSIAYFMNPNYDAEITALPGCEAHRTALPTVTAGQYLIEKFRSAF